MINAFDVEGVAQLDQGTVEDAVYPFTGPDRTSLDVEAARARHCQQAYAKHGFERCRSTCRRSPRRRSARASSRSRLGSADRLGDRERLKFHSLAVIRRQLPSVVEGKALNLIVARERSRRREPLPGTVSINPSFVAGKVPGTVDVDLEVTDSLPVHGSIELTNDHSPSTVPLRLTANVSYANLWQLRAQHFGDLHRRAAGPAPVRGVLRVLHPFRSSARRGRWCSTATARTATSTRWAGRRCWATAIRSARASSIGCPIRRSCRM